jgi:TonB family protein
MILLFDSALRATVILATTWIVAQWLRRSSADLRRMLWLAAIVAVAVLPGLLWLAPATLTPVRFISGAEVMVSAATAPERVFPWAPTIWAAGVLGVLLRLGFGLTGVFRLTRSAYPSPDGVLYSDRVATPLTWGVFRPVILLPAYMKEWPAEQRETVVRHERAHIDACDWLCQVFARVVSAVFWFHPLIWLANAQFRVEGERRADDRVLAGGESATRYAAQLLEVARHLRRTTPSAAVAMVRKPALEERVREILDPTRQRTPAGRWSRIAVVTTAVAMVLPLAAMQRGKVYKIGDAGVTPPTVASKVEPQYTPAARKARLEGPVELKLEVNERGEPRNIRVVKKLDDGLDANAKKAIQRWHFNPGLKDGKPIRIEANVQVNFHLLK